MVIILASTVLYIDLPGSLSICPRHRCVMKCWVRCFWYWILPQLSGAFSGLLAAAIENMNGIGGRPGWAWILILVRFGNICHFIAMLNYYHIGRIVFGSRWHYLFLPSTFYTPRFQVFNWIPERVSLSSSYIFYLHLKYLLSSDSSWGVWKEIDHSLHRLMNSVSKKSCEPPVPLMSSSRPSLSSWPERWVTASPFFSHRLLTS